MKDNPNLTFNSHKSIYTVNFTNSIVDMAISIASSEVNSNKPNSILIREIIDNNIDDMSRNSDDQYNSNNITGLDLPILSDIYVLGKKIPVDNLYDIFNYVLYNVLDIYDTLCTNNTFKLTECNHYNFSISAIDTNGNVLFESTNEINTNFRNWYGLAQLIMRDNNTQLM